jgi:hypothetical protein
MSLRKELEALVEELAAMKDGEYLDLYSSGIRQGKRMSALMLKNLLQKYPDDLKDDNDGRILNDEC